MKAHTLIGIALVGALAGPARADDGVVQGDGFVVAVTAAPAVAGSLVAVTVVLTPSAGYKVNDEYPLSLQIQGPADVAVPKARLLRADATSVRHDRAVFTVPVTPKVAGDKALSFTFKFALCTTTTCEPRKQALGFTLRVR